MKNKFKIFAGAIVAFVFSIVMLNTVKAASTATLAWSGSGSVAVNDTLTLTIGANSISGGGKLMGVGGTVSIADTSCVSLESITPVNDSADANGGKFSFLSMNGTASDVSFVEVKLKAGASACSTTVTITSPTLSFTDGTNINAGNVPKTITVTAAKDTNNNLASLSLGSTVTMSPTFNKSTTAYTASVPNATSSVTVTGACESAKATISGTGNKSLTVGSNTITVTCTSESGSPKNYTITVTRAAAAAPTKSSDANLKTLSPSGYTGMTPTFVPNVTSYSLTVPATSTSITFDADANDPKATVTGKTCNLSAATTTCTIKVTAEDGTVKNYKVVVKKEAADPGTVTKDDDATLKVLNVSGYTLSPTFKPGTNNYSMTVASNITGLKVTATPNKSTTTCSVKGNTGWTYGVNTIMITCKAQAGNTNTYTVNVTRKAATPTGGTEGGTTPTKPEKTEPKSGDATLAGLTVTGGDINPRFDPKTKTYDITVPYEYDKLDISYIPGSDKAKVEIFGNDDLRVGMVNPVNIKVTAEDGTVNIYTINAKRSPVESNTYLKDLSAPGTTLAVLFDKEVEKYSVTVKHNVTSLDLSAIAKNPKANVQIVGNEDFQVGENKVYIKVTDENGFTRIYEITVTRRDLTILGMSVGKFIAYLLLGLLLLFILSLLFLLLTRKKDNEQPQVVVQPTAPTPVPTIDFKPEFNFGSKNGTDDDIVYPNAQLNQDSHVSNAELPSGEERKLIGSVPAHEHHAAKYDPYDEEVTKDELIDAIHEGIETRNPEKLKILLQQEELNRAKEELKEREESRSDKYNDRW